MTAFTRTKRLFVSCAIASAMLVLPQPGGRHIKLAGNDKLRIERDTPEPRDRAQLIRDVLRSLGQPQAVAA